MLGRLKNEKHKTEDQARRALQATKEDEQK
jgi:hypothetical protein